MSTRAAEELLAETKDGVRVLTLNRPEALNSLTPALLKALGAALKDAAKDRAARCVVLTGAGKAFCAGADLAGFKADGGGLGEHVRAHFNPAARALAGLEKPVVAAVNGAAAGAGVGLALACDLRVLSEKAQLHPAFIKVGLAPDTGVSWFLARALGPAAALEHLWLGAPIGAERAKAAGLANRVVPPEAVLEEALGLARALAAGPPKAMALTKRAVRSALELELDAQLDREARLQEIAGRTKDHREGVAAFFEKRAPRFTGE